MRIRPAKVAGEAVLASATSPDGELSGTRDALHLPDGTRLPWEQVEAAEWDSEASTFRLTGVGVWGAARPAYLFTLERPDKLLQLVRERVTASIVLQRHVPVDGELGVRIIADSGPSCYATRPPAPPTA